MFDAIEMYEPEFSTDAHTNIPGHTLVFPDKVDLPLSRIGVSSLSQAGTDRLCILERGIGALAFCRMHVALFTFLISETKHLIGSCLMMIRVLLAYDRRVEPTMTTVEARGSNGRSVKLLAYIFMDQKTG